VAGVTSETIRVEGLAALTRKLKLLDDEAPKAVRVMNKEAAALALPVARSLAPEGGGASSPTDKHPGKLRGNVRAGATQRSGYIAVGSAGVPYAGPIMFGWKARNIEAHDPDHPFLFEAVDRVAPASVVKYESGLHSLIERVGLGG
jgi:hypothetical protein